MKKLFLLAVLLMTVVCVQAQNANKSGLFFDAGIGYAMGKLPVVDMALEESVISLDYPNSACLVIDAGYRYTKWKQSAVEMKFQYQGNFKKIAASSVIKIMPGYVHYFKLRKGRLFYAEANVGVAFGSKGLKSAYWKESGITSSRLSFQKVESAGALSPSAIGLGYGLEAGLTLGKLWSLSAAWDAQVLKQYSSEGLKTHNWGMMSVKIGMRL